MAPFYSRFNPTSNASTGKSVSELPTALSKKRKSEDERSDSRQDTKKSKKSADLRPGILKEEINGNSASRRGRPSESGINGSEEVVEDFQKAEQPNEGIHGGNPENPRGVIRTKSTCEQALHGAQAVVMSTAGGKVDRSGVENGNEDQSTIGKVKRKKLKATNVAVNGSEKPDADMAKVNQHASMRSKFEKVTKKPVDTLPYSDDGIDQKKSEPLPPGEVHGLEPLPQPPQILAPVERPTFSSLPSWLANPLRVDSTQSAHFNDLGLDVAILENIRKQGLTAAFPVQSAVMPLLLGGRSRHQGDICISAATGSGKTLAYVIPMIQDLTNLATTRLRGLIVVPTRELVRQAKDVCEACAAGTRLKIATALGSKSLHDEQEVLVESYDIYDPEEYQRQQSGQVDWSKVDVAGILSDLENEEQPARNLVRRYRSRVDILICTPGRLVDHIRSTKGFTLDHVQWLIIDEADRLLNESFQEWTDTVIPALQSRKSHALQDQVLRQMRLEVSERVVRKVILSATLTHDISKLNSLKLRNPKLVVVGDVNTPMTDVNENLALNPQPHESGSFNLPTTLIEHAVPAGDGSDKPLYLLELLRTKVDVFNLQSCEDSKLSDEQDSDGSSASESSDVGSESTSSQSTTSDTSPLSTTRKSRPLSSNDTTRPTKNTALIFTRSTESATRLTRLLSLLSAPISSMTTTLTKSSTSSSTRKALTNFRQHKIQIIIATDRASRGLDLPNLGHVISYDVPTSVTTYVHRVGRTARAGKAGHAWTLLAHREARWFWNDIGKGVGDTGTIVRNGKVRRLNLNLDVRKDDGTGERYEKALKTLGEEVDGRRDGGGR